MTKSFEINFLSYYCFHKKQEIIIAVLSLLFICSICQSCNREVIDFEDRPTLLFSKSEAPLIIEYYSDLKTDSFKSSKIRYVLDRLTNRVDSIIYDFGYFNKYFYSEDSILAVTAKDTSFIYLVENKIVANIFKGGFQLYMYNEKGYLHFINNTSLSTSQFTYKSNNDLDYITNNNSTTDYYIFHDSLVFNPKLINNDFNPFRSLYAYGYPGHMNRWGKETNKLIKAIHRYQNGNIIAYTNYDWKIEGDRILSVDIHKFSPFGTGIERYIFHYDK